MKRLNKIIYVLMIIIIVCSVPCRVEAKDFFEKANDWIETGTEGKEKSATGNDKLVKMEDIAKTSFEEVLDFIWSIGLLVVFVSTIILGIKYMFASPDEKSKIKQATTPYIIGVVIIFGAVTIWKITIDLLTGSL